MDLNAIPDNVLMKRCNRCKYLLPFSEYTKDAYKKDGLRTICKKCTNASNKSEKTKESARLRIAELRKTDKWKEYYKAKSKEWLKTEKGRAYKAKSSALQSAKDSEKRKARAAVNSAVRYGKLIKGPCIKCGCLDVEGHHPDYSRPLDVIWLCNKHHNEEHGK